MQCNDRQPEKQVTLVQRNDTKQREQRLAACLGLGSSRVQNRAVLFLKCKIASYQVTPQCGVKTELPRVHVNPSAEVIKQENNKLPTFTGMYKKDDQTPHGRVTKPSIHSHQASTTNSRDQRYSPPTQRESSQPILHNEGREGGEREGKDGRSKRI